MLPAGSLGTVRTDIARTFAALNATNEAILYAKSPEELYAKVCEAAFSVGDFLAVYEPLIEQGSDILSIHLSGGISGTVRSAEQARDQLVERYRELAPFVR